MRVKMVLHSSVLLQTSDAAILSDPWYQGKAFNDSWGLILPPAINDHDYDAIDYLWISHEHADHFNVPTLRSLPDSFKARVTVLFQKLNSQKVTNALGKFGFRNFITLPHRKWVRLTDSTEVACHQSGSMDSTLSVRADGRLAVNVNDCQLSESDCQALAKDVGAPDLVLTQYSLAGYTGMADRPRFARASAQRHLNKVAMIHRELGAGVTIPFASHAYFCTEDNRFINDYANRPGDVARRLAHEGLETVVLYPARFRPRDNFL